MVRRIVVESHHSHSSIFMPPKPERDGQREMEREKEEE